MRFLIIISIIFHSGCESNRFENWNEMKNKIINQESEIDSLKALVSSRLAEFYQLESRVNYLNDEIKSKRKNYNFYELTINSSGYYGEGKSVKRFPGRINSLNIYKFYKFIYQDKTDLFLKRKKETIENHLKEANKNSIDDIVFY